MKTSVIFSPCLRQGCMKDLSLFGNLQESKISNISEMLECCLVMLEHPLADVAHP